MGTDTETFVRRVGIVLGLTALAGVLVFLLWVASDVLFLVFCAILLAAFLRGLSQWISHRTPLSSTWALAMVVLTLLLLVAASVWFLAPAVATQADQLSDGLTQSLQQLQGRLDRYAWARWMMERAPSLSQLAKRANLFSQLTGVFSTTLGLVTNLVVVAFLALYLAASPQTYLHGLVRLFPQGRRPRITEVLDEVGTTLYHWTLGRLVLMLINGALTALGLWLLGIPLALTLGILAGTLNFVPNIGPIIAAVPAVLIGWTHGSSTALWVVLLYLFLQNLDGYVFTPLVQKRTVSLAPALTILAQVLFGVLAGSFGLLLATPLTATAVVLIRRFYLEDTLGDRPADMPGMTPRGARDGISGSTSTKSNPQIPKLA